eukprot:NODE_4782_length_1848_cov_5.959326.p1 GENE.NODE_4782_length_1848_cov_5.959326~~NODE_4782_length_1848_cov_5.959326.p1  ORF type:complete len:587 (-),score=137.27 NODE_4782_length_1848_cov_5.959326:87-1847(-)
MGPLHIDPPCVGLRNLASTCYLNAVLQCLAHTPLLCDHLITAFKAPIGSGDWLTELAALFQEMRRARLESRVVSAEKVAALITQNKEFVLGQQADAHEAFMLVLNQTLVGCVGTAASSDHTGRLQEQLEQSSLVGHVFGLEMQQTIHCTSGVCSYESTASHAEYCLCLPIALGLTERERAALQRQAEQALVRYQTPQVQRYGQTNVQTQTPTTNLMELLRHFTRPQRIDGYKCECCASSCTRATCIGRPPNVLTIYIDRRQDTSLFGKINRRVQFDQRLDLSQIVHRLNGASAAFSEKHLYSLYAVIVHHDVNQSTFFGHYVAYIRSRMGNWSLLDDQSVTPTTWANVQNQHAYLLLYAADNPILPPVVEGLGLGMAAASPESVAVAAAPTAEEPALDDVVLGKGGPADAVTGVDSPEAPVTGAATVENPPPDGAHQAAGAEMPIQAEAPDAVAAVEAAVAAAPVPEPSVVVPQPVPVAGMAGVAAAVEIPVSIAETPVDTEEATPAEATAAVRPAVTAGADALDGNRASAAEAVADAAASEPSPSRQLEPASPEPGWVMVPDAHHCFFDFDALEDLGEVMCAVAS